MFFFKTLLFSKFWLGKIGFFYFVIRFRADFNWYWHFNKVHSSLYTPIAYRLRIWLLRCNPISIWMLICCFIHPKIEGKKTILLNKNIRLFTKSEHFFVLNLATIFFCSQLFIEKNNNTLRYMFLHFNVVRRKESQDIFVPMTRLTHQYFLSKEMNADQQIWNMDQMST